MRQLPERHRRAHIRGLRGIYFVRVTTPRLVGDRHGPRAWTPAGSPLRLRTSLWTRADGMTPELTDGLRLLDARLRSFIVTGEHRVPDGIFGDLAIDVQEQARVVVHLLESPYRRAVLANARAAVESAIDATVLTARESEYDRRGADAYVFGVLDVEALERRMGIEATRLVGQSESAEAQVAEDAAAWDAVAPGKGSILRQAFEQFPKRDDLSRKHWSGLTNKQLYAAVTATLPAGSRTISRALEGMYSVLSMHAHPRPRFGHRRGLDANGESPPRRVAHEEELEMITTTTWVALMLAVRALDARWRFRP